MELCALQVARQEICFADVFMRAAMSRVEVDGALVVLERKVELLQVAVGVAQAVLQVGLSRMALFRALIELYGDRPVFPLSRRFSRRIVLIALVEIRVA